MLPPAALSSASTRPYAFKISARFCSKTSRFNTSVTRNMASPPWALISFTIWLPTSALRPKITTLAPSSAKWLAIAFPRTPVPPVITTTLSFTLNKFAMI